MAAAPSGLKSEPTQPQELPATPKRKLLEPSLTAVGYDTGEVGRSAAALLVDAMRDAGLDGAEARREVRVPVQLVRRRSCGCEGEA